MAQTPKKFAVRMTKACGENEVVEVTFGADDAGEFTTLLDKACAVIEHRMERNNTRVLKVGEALQAKVSEIRAGLRAEIEAEVRADAQRLLRGTDGAPDGAADVRPDP